MAIDIDSSGSDDSRVDTPRPTRKKKEEKVALVEVSWDDAYTSDWTPANEVSCPELISVGWLVSQDDKEIKIGGTIGEDDAPYGITAFPKGCVLEINFI